MKFVCQIIFNTNYNIMEEIFDNEAALNFSKPNRLKTHPLGKTNYDIWYEDKPHTDAITKNWGKIRGILKKNVGKDFSKVRNEIIQKCARNDYEKYLIKDYLQTYVYTYTEAENDDKLSYLEDMFYTDSNGLVRHRTNREPKDKQYATFTTPIEDRLYHYTLRDDISDDDDVRKYIMLQFFKEFGADYIIKTFKEDEVNNICRKISDDANLIKKADEKRYNNYLNLIKHYGKQYNDEDFVKYYFFKKHCVNPQVTVERNSKEYWKLRKCQHKEISNAI